MHRGASLCPQQGGQAALQRGWASLQELGALNYFCAIPLVSGEAFGSRPRMAFLFFLISGTLHSLQDLSSATSD